MSECSVKVLECDITTLETTDKRIRVAFLKDKLSMIPIPQVDIPRRRFTRNSGPRFTTLLSGELGVEGIIPSIILCEVMAGKKISFDLYTTTRSRHVCCQLATFTYRCTDFVEVQMLENGYITDRYMRSEVAKKYGVEVKSLQPYNYNDVSSNSQGRKSIKNTMFLLKDKRIEELRKEMPNKRLVEVETFDDLFVNLALIEEKNYEFGMKTYGNIPVFDLINMIFDNIIGRLQTMHGLLSNDKYSAVKIIKNGINANITVENESMTIGEILTHYCKEVDKEIAYVSANIKDPRQHAFQIKMTHPEPDKVLILAAEQAVKEITGLKEQFLNKLK